MTDWTPLDDELDRMEMPFPVWWRDDDALTDTTALNRLIRLSYGPFQLGQLKPGAVEEIRPRVLRDQLGMKDEDAPQEAKPKPKPQRRRR